MKKLLSVFAGLLFACTLQAQTIIYHENFESPSFGDSVVSSGTPNPWSVNTRIFASGARCDSNYVQATDTSFLTTSSFNCSGYGNVILKFNHICKIELLDGGEVQISTDNGLTWTSLTGTQYLGPAYSQFASNGNKFNAYTYITPNAWSYAVADAKPQSSWFMPEQFDISAIAGNQPNVKIRFLLRDGNGNGANYHHGWFIDDIQILASFSEMIPPVITYKAPLVQDTVFSTGPFDIFAGIKDASGIDTAWLVYTVNGGSAINVPMTWISDTTYKGTIPSFTWNTAISYYVHAEDNSPAHNGANATVKNFYIKQGPSVITIGTGTNSIEYPYYTYYHDARTQMLYSASSIIAAGGSGGQITAIALNVASVGGLTMNSFNIKMRNYTGGSLSGFVGTGMTTVFSGSYLPEGTGWQTINLTTPFGWDGSSDLLIEICYDNTAWSSSSEVYGSTASSNVIYQGQDYSTGCTLSSPSAGSYLPNIQLSFPANTNQFDAGITQISEPNGTLIGSGPFPVKVTMKNFSIDTLTTVKIKYSVDGILKDSTTWTGTLFAGMSSPVIAIDTTVFGLGQHLLKAWTVKPNGGSDQNQLNDTASIVFFVCDSLLSGTYTIGGGGDFATLTSAIGALNNCGIGGPVVFNIASGTYNETINLGVVSGVSAVNTITFKPAAGANVTITKSASTAVVTLSGSDYIIFDGSNNGTNSRNLSIVNTSTASGTAAVLIASLGTGAGATHNTLKNCNIIAGSSSATTYGISIGTAVGSAGADNDYLSIRNNVVEKAYYGIYAEGTAAGVLDSLQILSNTFGSDVATSYIGMNGISVAYGTGGVLRGNTIYNIITNQGTPAGIRVGSNFINAEIGQNKIYNLIYTGTSGIGGRGIYANTGVTASNVTIANNMISSIGGDGYTSFGNSSPVGIFLDGTSGGFNVWYNTVSLTGNMTYSSGSLSAAMLLNSATITNVNIRNNIFINTMTNTASSTYKQYAIYSYANATAFTSINYNDYFVSGTQGVLGYLGSNRATLADWRTATGQDVNSVNTDVVFINSNNLHTYSASVNNLGVSIPAVSVDIDGEARHATTPDLGADEFSPLTNDIAMLSILAPVNGCGYTNVPVQVRIKNFGSDPITSAELYYTLNGGAPVHETFSGSIAQNASYDYTFTTLANVSAPGTYVIDAWASLAGDVNTLNDSVFNHSFYSGYNFGLGAYTNGFETTDYLGDWSVLDVNADTRTWQIPYNSTTYAHTGNNCARFYNSSTLSGNDWLFSRCFNLTAGSVYQVEFWYRAENSGYPQKISLKYGNTATAAAMTNTIISYTNITNTTWQKSTATFTPATSGVYYLGWYANSNPAAYNAYIDDINISEIPAQEATAIELSTPTNGCGLTTTEPVTLKIKNTGSQAISGNLTATYQIGSSSPVSESVAATIAVGDTLDYVFTTTADLSVLTQDSIFSFTAWVRLTGDPMYFNDSVSKEVKSKFIPVAPVAVGDTIAYGAQATLTATSPYNLSWWDALTGGNKVGTGSTFVTPALFATTTYYVSASAGEGSVSWTFDSDLEGWTASSPCSSPVTWAFKDDGGIGTAFAVDHSTYSSQLLVSPEIELSGATSVDLSLVHRWGTESGYDHGYVAYRLDGGAWNQYIPTTNGYNTNDSEAGDPLFSSCSSSADMPLFDGASGYVTSSGPINVAGANKLQIALVFTTDGSGAVDGWYVDEVTVSGIPMCESTRIPDTAKVNLPAVEASDLGITLPLGGCSDGTEPVSILIRNNGTDTITTIDASYKAGTAAVVTETINSVLLPGDTLNYAFSTLLNTGISNAYPDTTLIIMTWVSLAGDPYALNDSASAEVSFSRNLDPPVVANVSIPYATSTTLFAASADSVSWYDAITGGNLLGESHNFTTPLLYGTTVYYAQSVRLAPGFLLESVETTNAAVVDHDSYSGDDRGGIAVTENYFYVVGDVNTARFNMPDLTNPVSLPIRDGIFSDLSGHGTLYTLWNGTAGPAGSSLSTNYSVTAIRGLNDDLTFGSTIIPLSQTISMGDNAAIFAGRGFVILFNGISGSPANTFYKVAIPSGIVTNLGTHTASYNTGENWASWGVAELWDDEYSVDFINGSDQMIRMNPATGATTTIHAYTDLSDMNNFTVAPWYDRWYFHHESSSQFGGTAETAGYADATITTKTKCPGPRAADTVFVTGNPGCDVSANQILSPVSAIEMNNAETVVVRIINHGTDPMMNIPVSYSINGGATVSEIIAGTLVSGGDTLYAFTTPADFSVLGTYTLTAWTSLACDTIFVNDTTEKIIVNSPLQYCVSEAGYTDDDDIGNVTFSGINNGVANPILSNPGSVNTYSDFTSLPPAQIIAGSSEPIAITQIENYSWFNDCLVNVYIDWNRNGEFDLPEELVFSQATGYDEEFPTVSGTVNVPVAGVVTNKNILMRVVLDEYNVAPPCGNYSYGETEDYFVVVKPQIQFDAGVTNILQPLALEDEGNSVPVQVAVKNFGYDTIRDATGVMVSYAVNGQAPVSTPYNGGDLAPGASVAITLPAMTVPAGNADICAWTSLAADTYTMNDTTCFHFYGEPKFDAAVMQFLQPLNFTASENASNTVEVVIANQGSDTLTSFPVSYTLNGTVQGTESWTGMLLPGSTDTVLFAQAYTVPLGAHTICAYTGLVNDGDHTNDTLCSAGLGLLTSTLPYYDNFDGTVNWTTENLEPGTVWELGTPSYELTNSAHSAPNAWDVNLSTAYNSDALSYLYTQNFDFSTVTNAKISFWVNVDVETCCDGLTLQYSTDGSTTWQTLGTVSDPNGTNWYTDENDYDCWTSTGGWIKAEYPLSALNNTPLVRFRFVFFSDVSSEASGASVDDFALYVPSPIDAGVEQIKLPSGIAPSGSSKVVKTLIRNFGSDTLTSIPVSYKVNGGSPVSGTWTGQLLPNDTVTYTFTTQMVVPAGLYTLCAYTGVVGDGDHMNDTICKDLNGIITVTVPWSDDMESTVYWFDEGGNASWEYGVPASTTINAAHSPTHCWKTNLDGYYMNNSQDYLYTPYLDFTQVANATFDFWHWYQTESGYDGGKIEYTVNGGSTWISLGYNGDANGTNWFNSSISGSGYWSGNSSGWVHSTYNLSAIPAIVNATTPVQFRFKFYSSASGNSYDGWAVDDFSITAPAIPKDAGVIAVVTPSGSSVTGSPVTVKVTLQNFGTDTLQTIPVAYQVNGGAITTEYWSGVLQPATTTDFTFTATFNAPASDYELCAFTKKAGDTYRFNDTTCVSITSTPALNDVGVASVISPTDSTLAGSAVAVKILIKNYGTNTQTSIPVGYTRNGVQMATATWTGSLASGDTVSYIFTQTYVSPMSNYQLCGFTMLPGDSYTANDQTCAYPMGYTGIDEVSGNGFFVMQNVPNPANDVANIDYQIPSSGKVKFEVRNVLGKLMVSEEKSAAAGTHRIGLNVKTWSSGLYYYTVEFGGQRITKKMMVNP